MGVLSACGEESVIATKINTAVDKQANELTDRPKEPIEECLMTAMKKTARIQNPRCQPKAPFLPKLALNPFACDRRHLALRKRRLRQSLKMWDGYTSIYYNSLNL